MYSSYLCLFCAHITFFFISFKQQTLLIYLLWLANIYEGTFNDMNENHWRNFPWVTLTISSVDTQHVQTLPRFAQPQFPTKQMSIKNCVFVCNQCAYINQPVVSAVNQTPVRCRSEQVTFCVYNLRNVLLYRFGLFVRRFCGLCALGI